MLLAFRSLLIAVVGVALLAAGCGERDLPAGPTEGGVGGVADTQNLASRGAGTPLVFAQTVVADAQVGAAPRVHSATMGYATVEVDVSARDGGLDVTWSGALEHAENVRVRAFVGAGRDAVFDQTFDAATTSAMISGLTNGVGYQVQVDVLGPGGFGLGGGRGYGTPVAGTVSLPRPGQVRGVRVEARSRALLVSWSAPSGSSFNQFRVDAVAQGFDHRRRVYAGEHDDQALVERLRGGVTYAVTVRALHRTGGPDGADSDPLTVMLPGRPPAIASVRLIGLYHKLRGPYGAPHRHAGPYVRGVSAEWTSVPHPWKVRAAIRIDDAPWRVLSPWSAGMPITDGHFYGSFIVWERGTYRASFGVRIYTGRLSYRVQAFLPGPDIEGPWSDAASWDFLRGRPLWCHRQRGCY